jgi:hypothetical protein
MSLDDTIQDPEELRKKMQQALNLQQSLPDDTFVAVPDNEVVTLQISGQFGRVLNRALEYLYQAEDEETVIAAATLVKNNFEGADPIQATPFAVTLWAISNLCADFSVQAGIQKKTRIYDREEFISNLFGNGVVGSTPQGKAVYKDPEPIEPLDEEELVKRIKADKDGKTDYKTDNELRTIGREKAKDNRNKIQNLKTKGRLDKKSPEYQRHMQQELEKRDRMRAKNTDSNHDSSVG